MYIYLFEQSVSKKHSTIELSVKEDGELDECVICDLGSRNKTKFSENIVKQDENKSIKLNDSVQFGVVRFNLVKVSIAFKCKYYFQE